MPSMLPESQHASSYLPPLTPLLHIAAPVPQLPMSIELAHQQQLADMSRPLNVTDALGYLDAVKNQFQDLPDVYNQFLDIMKDFKSQVIDTPGVIQRVSRLFHGNPALIQGFNTFLPVGYRIDISADPLDHTITVTTPTGTTKQTTGTNVILSRTPREQAPPIQPPLPAAAALAGPGLVVNPAAPMYPSTGPPAPPPPPAHAPGSTLLAGPGGPISRALTPHGYPQHPLVDPATFSPGFQQQTTAASFLGNLNGKNNHGGGPAVPADAGGPPTEFNHAIQYLNKIKARYADDQNTYKQFLDILQTYQREGKHSQDKQVYLQVQMLFKDAPDLIVEFKNFLPEAVGGLGGIGQDAAAMMMASSQHQQGPQMGAGGWQQQQQDMRQQQQQLPPSPPPPTKKVAPAKRRKRAAEKELTPVPPPSKAASSRQTKKVKHHHLPDTESPSFSPHVVPRSPPPPSHMYHSNSGQHGHISSSQQPLPLHHGPNASSSSGAPADKLMFFDRAKKALESKEVYEEFLKLLSLFSKDIIDVRTLIDRAKVFLGEDSLMGEFKDLVGWDERMEHPIEHGPPGSIRTQAPDACAPQPVDDGEGPSYRKLPDSEIRLACSGRDELCRSVLNDKWVSHPTWASEEAGFVAHKKNSFEEALHKSEEERHEYHVHLEALGRTISLLEPLNARIEEMMPEERAAFRLKADFGGPSRTLYHRTIKRIYGRDNTAEILQAMQEGPSVAVPVVLARLKQKDEDWRRALREWSRTWREVDSKNFYKSLDHQGISFKQNDKKNITARHFVADIEAIQAQQVREWEEEHGNGTSKPFWKGTMGHQLEYAFSDTGVLSDSLKLVYSFLDRSQVQYSPQERRTVEKFLRAFIPKLCHFPEAELNAGCGPLEGGPSATSTGGGGGADEEHDGAANSADGPKSGKRSNGSSYSNGQSNGVPANDLRKKLLKTAQEKASRKDKDAMAGPDSTRGTNSGMGSRAGTPSPVVESSRFAHLDEDGRVIPDIWVKEAPVASGSEASAASGADLLRPFFANTTFYTLLRLLQLLYSRLLMCKEIGVELAEKKHAPLLANQVALELGLVDPSGPSVVLAQSMEALGERPPNESTRPPNVVYMYLLNACEKLFDSDMDQATFEEHMRWFFGTKAYHLFTLDKLITVLVKQVQTVLSDHKCQELWTLLQLAQGSEHITKQDIVRYRRSAEKHVGQDDHLYRIQWDREKKCVRVSLTGHDDATIETDGKAKSRWREYVNTYVMTYPTEWVPPAKPRVSPTFLRRCTQGNEEGSTASTVIVDDHTRVRISLPAYKLVYENGCEDVLVRRWSAEEGEMLRERARARSEDRKRSRWLTSGDTLVMGSLVSIPVGQGRGGGIVLSSLRPLLCSSSSDAVSTPFSPLCSLSALNIAHSPLPHTPEQRSTRILLVYKDLLGTQEILKPSCIMAKPFTVASTDGASTSDSTPHRRSRHHEQPCKPHRRRRKAAGAAARALGPSATLLSLLSIVAASSVAEGSPAPPAFLCPSAQPTSTPTRRRVRRDVKLVSGTSKAVKTTSTSQTVPRAIVRNIPDKYEQGEDGLWRRVESFTFYGVCAMGCSTTAVSALDDQISRNPNDTTTTTDITDADYDTKPAKLPPGWEPKETKTGHESRTMLILAMSLVLAFFICFLIIGCLFWRKSMRRRYKERDVEGKGKGKRRNRELSLEEEKEIIAEKEIKGKQKLWSRATARWRENARYSARQRRGKRPSVRSRAQRSSTSLDNPRDGLTSGRSSPTPSGSTPPSRTISRRPSLISMHHEPLTDTQTPTPDPESAIPTISLSPPPAPPPQSSPPAYQQKALKGAHSSDGLYSNDGPASTSRLLYSRQPSRSSFFATPESEIGDISSIPAAHVATDDKAVLARLADLASAPPSDDNADSSGHREEVSAPEWRDEEMEDFIAQTDDVSNQAPATPSPFPPPPTKGNLHAPNFYDYPYTFEEMELAGMEPELGPSAPPFEEHPSVDVPVDERDITLMPSAPPLLDQDDFYVDDDPSPSAPDLRGPVDEHDQEEASNGQSPAGFSGAPAACHHHQHGVTGDCNPRRSTDGPTLPDYHP